MEAFLAECCFVFGCEGLSSTKEECFKAQIVELRCAIRRMTLVQTIPQRRNAQTEKDELELPLYEEKDGVFTPTGTHLVF